MIALTWLVLVVGLCAALPLGWLLRGRPRLALLAWTALGALPFLGSLDIGLVTLTEFLGDTHGLEIALVDFLALVLVFSRPLSARGVPYRLALGLYFAVALFSVTQAALPLPALLYSWRLLRFGLLFFAVVRGATTLTVVLAILRGTAIGVGYEFYLAMQQRFYTYQVPGSFAHQNSLGLAMNLVVMAPIALVLAGRAGWLAAASPLLGLVIVVLTRSRGALIFFVLGAALVYGLSLARRRSSRKVLVGVIGGVLALAVVARAAPRIAERFATAPVSSMDTRAQFEKAAGLMLDDHPLGIGANHFAWYLGELGYGARVGLDEFNRQAIVHNVYWLTAVELGPLGLVALAFLFLTPLVDAVRSAYRSPPSDVRGDVLMGLGVSLFACYAQGAFEWAWRATDVSYIYWIVVGLVGALSAQVRRRAVRAQRAGGVRRKKRRRAAAPEPSPEPDSPQPGSPEPAHAEATRPARAYRGRPYA
jgi:O-antigen ligase